MKTIRKAVRTFLIKENKVLAVKYKTYKNLNFYDIPGGKIEDGESPIDASIREFKEETGIVVGGHKYKGNVKIEYPDIIFDFDVYVVDEFKGNPLEFEENNSMWISIDELLNQNKKFPCIEILNYLHKEEIKLKIYSDENHNILKIESL